MNPREQHPRQYGPQRPHQPSPTTQAPATAAAPPPPRSKFAQDLERLGNEAMHVAATITGATASFALRIAEQADGKLVPSCTITGARVSPQDAPRALANIIQGALDFIADAAKRLEVEQSPDFLKAVRELETLTP